MINQNSIPPRAFGIGCFNFRLERRIPFSITPKEYAAELTKALSKLNNLSNLEITYDDSTENDVINFKEEIPSLRNGGVFPFLQFGVVSFSLYIPVRIQKEFGGPVDTKTEMFRISIRDNFYGPISFVECLNAGDDCDPSSAVRIVREYLEEEFNKERTITFEALGPSPFHADFFVYSAPIKSEIEVIHTPQRGYDRFDIYIEESSSFEVMDTTYETFDWELDLYYHLVREHRIQTHNWGILERTWSTLRADISNPTRFYQILKRFEFHKRTQNLIHMAYAFAADNSISKQSAAECLHSRYAKGLAFYFKPRCEARLKEAFPNYPIQEIISWATHAHDSSFKLAEIVTVLFSGLLGGILGAFITALLTTGNVK